MFSVGPLRGPFNRRLDLGGGLALLLPAPKLVGRGKVQLVAGPEWLNNRGEDETLPDLLAVVRSLVSGYAGAGTISRLDLATDLLMTVQDWDTLHRAVIDALRAGHLIHNGLDVTANWDGSEPTSINIGYGAPGMLRIYNKGHQAAKEGILDSWLPQWDLARIVDGYVVVRVEYQMQGEFLRNVESPLLDRLGVRTLDDMWAVSADLMRYLTAKWVRLAYREQGHEHKRELVPLWSVLSVLLVDAWGTPAAKVKRVWTRGGRSTVDKLSRLVLGASRSLGARMGYVDGCDGPIALDTVFRRLQRHESAGEVWKAGALDRHKALVYGAAA
jgi:hypothetical protein